MVLQETDDSPYSAGGVIPKISPCPLKSHHFLVCGASEPVHHHPSWELALFAVHKHTGFSAHFFAMNLLCSLSGQ